MTKVTLAIPIDERLLDDAQRLVDAGEFDSLRDLVAEALAALLRRYEMADAAAAVHPHTDESLESLAVKALIARLSPFERTQFDEFYAAYQKLADYPLNDEEMRRLLEFFIACDSKSGLMAALHIAQDSEVPLSLSYFEMLLEKEMRLAPMDAANPYGVAARLRGLNDPVLAEVATMYEQEIGKITAFVGDEMKDLVAEYHDIERWQRAYKAAADANVKQWRFVRACLLNDGKPKDVNDAKGKGKRGASKSERVREEKRRRNKDYDQYWDEKLKAKQKSREAK